MSRPGVLDVGDIQSGIDTTRLSVTETSQAVRREWRETVRCYVQRRYPDEADLFAAMLGLDETAAREPGLCFCGAKLASAATNESRSARHLGLCFKCARENGVA